MTEATPPPTDLVRHTARLAGLALSDEEVERFGPELARILAAFERLAHCELPADPPPPPAAAALRADLPRPTLAAELLLARAPEHRDGCYAVPRTVGGEG